MITVLKNAKIYDGGILKSCEAAFDGTSLTMTGAMGGGNSVSKFENVAIVYIDKNTTTFRIGSMNEDAILGKDYILIQKNINYKLIGIYN